MSCHYQRSTSEIHSYKFFILPFDSATVAYLILSSGWERINLKLIDRPLNIWSALPIDIKWLGMIFINSSPIWTLNDFLLKFHFRANLRHLKRFVSYDQDNQKPIKVTQFYCGQIRPLNRSFITERLQPTQKYWKFSLPFFGHSFSMWAYTELKLKKSVWKFASIIFMWWWWFSGLLLLGFKTNLPMKSGPSSRGSKTRASVFLKPPNQRFSGTFQMWQPFLSHQIWKCWK